MKKVVIIDDEADIAYIVSFELKNLGYQTFTFSAPEEALEFLKNHSVDAVICDFRMPNMDGLQVFLALKASGYSMPFFILTGEAMMETKSILAHGVADVLFKPHDMTKIKNVFQSHLG